MQRVSMLVATVFVVVVCLSSSCNGAPDLSHEVSACFGISDCSFLVLSCPEPERIFIQNGRYGYKFFNTSCSDDPVNCTDFTCCQPEPHDCFERLFDGHFEMLITDYNYCWNASFCNTTAFASIDGCPGHYAQYTPSSLYSTLNYTCLGDSAILSFNSSSSLSAPGLALHYDPKHPYPVKPSATRIWQCIVQSQDGKSHPAHVTWVKGRGSQGQSETCLSVRVNNFEFLPCKYGVSYNDSSVATPFSVFLRVSVSDPVPDAWAVVLATDGSDVTVACKETGDLPSMQQHNQATDKVTTDKVTTDKVTTDKLRGVLVD